MDLVLLSFFLIGVGSEITLLYVNYLARVRYKDYFAEMNRVWRWFDLKGLVHVALILGFLVGIGLLTLGLIIVSHSVVAFVAGLIAMNAMFDIETFQRRLVCIKLKCNKLEERAKCTKCGLQEEYEGGFLTLKLYRRKEETSFKQRYAHIIDFLKWIYKQPKRILNKILEYVEHID